MKNEHTHGPWIMLPPDRNTNIAIYPASCPNPKTHFDEIATVIGYYGGYNENVTANARLIAAAPELLKALEGLVASFPEFDTDEELNIGNVVDELARRREAIKAVIAKAKGD